MLDPYRKGGGPAEIGVQKEERALRKGIYGRGSRGEILKTKRFSLISKKQKMFEVVRAGSTEQGRPMGIFSTKAVEQTELSPMGGPNLAIQCADNRKKIATSTKGKA